MESDADDPPEQMDAPEPGGNPFDGNERGMTLEGSYMVMVGSYNDNCRTVDLN